jgi:hypothetical protein
MLNKLLETCLQRFDSLTQNLFEMTEPLETYNLMRTIYMESCPSLFPQIDPISIEEE